MFINFDETASGSQKVWINANLLGERNPEKYITLSTSVQKAIIAELVEAGVKPRLVGQPTQKVEVTKPVRESVTVKPSRKAKATAEA